MPRSCKAATGKTWYYTFAQRDGGTNGQGNLILSTFPFEATGSDDAQLLALGGARADCRQRRPGEPLLHPSRCRFERPSRPADGRAEGLGGELLAAAHLRRRLQRLAGRRRNRQHDGGRPRRLGDRQGQRHRDRLRRQRGGQHAQQPHRLHLVFEERHAAGPEGRAGLRHPRLAAARCRRIIGRSWRRSRSARRPRRPRLRAGSGTSKVTGGFRRRPEVGYQRLPARHRRVVRRPLRWSRRAAGLWGAPSLGDIPVAGDYDGDGRAGHRGVPADRRHLARCVQSATGAATRSTWGAGGDIPVAGRLRRRRQDRHRGVPAVDRHVVHRPLEHRRRPLA